MGTWWLVTTREAAHPAVISVYLALTGEANAQLSLSHLVVLRSLWNFGFHNLSLHESWKVLQVANPRFTCKRLKCLSGTQESHCWACSNNCVSCGCHRLCFTLCFYLSSMHLSIVYTLLHLLLLMIAKLHLQV